MVFGRKSKAAIAQQQQQLASLQAQVRFMQNSQQNVPLAAPTHIHHHTREIVNNVPQYIGLPMGAETLPPLVVNEFADPALPLTPLANDAIVLPQEWAAAPMAPATPMTPLEQVATPLEFRAPVEYQSHLQHLDGTWEHQRWWE
jgi:hypothetical protein